MFRVGHLTDEVFSGESLRCLKCGNNWHSFTLVVRLLNIHPDRGVIGKTLQLVCLCNVTGEAHGRSQRLPRFRALLRRLLHRIRRCEHCEVDLESWDG